MPRWEPDAVGRLQTAAFELFAERGFERTTIAEITERAGLTKRTFFNYFADKREVLFGPVSELQQTTVTREILACGDVVSPLRAALAGLQAAADAVFEDRRDAVIRRRRIIEANPELREREAGKRQALTDVIAAALVATGVGEDAALLVARASVLLQQTAMESWMRAADDQPLREHLREAFNSLRAVIDQSRTD